MSDVDTPSVTLYEGVPGATETTLYTAKVRTTVRSIHLSGDATGGTITVHVRPGGAAAVAGNAIAQAFAVAAAASVDLLAAIEMDAIALNDGDILSALQSSGTHITALVSGHVYGEA